MNKFIYNEMMIHIPLCTHKEPKNILIVSDSPSGLQNEIKKHNSVDSDSIKCSLDELSKLNDDAYDVVVSQMQADALYLSQVNRILNDDGILVIKHPSLDEVDSNKSLMKILGGYFKIIMPYNLGDGSTALFCSKTYHPTADIILQRTDMLDALEYYNCDIHPAAFAMGNNVRKAYLGTIKN
jgi:spermidine synthase